MTSSSLLTAGHGLLAAGLRPPLTAGFWPPLTAGLLAAGLLTAGLRLHAMGLLLLATGLCPPSSPSLLVVHGNLDEQTKEFSTSLQSLG